MKHPGHQSVHSGHICNLLRAFCFTYRWKR